MSQKRQIYILDKRILDESRSGWNLGDKETGLDTGSGLFDVDYGQLKIGMILRRTVTNTNDYTVYLKRVKNPKEKWTNRVFRSQNTGYIRDIQYLDEHSFSPGDIIEIRATILDEDI